MSIYGMHYETEEFWLDPSAKRYSQKNNAACLANEIGCAINHVECFWLSCLLPSGEMKFWFPFSPLINILRIYLFALDYSYTWHYNVLRQSSWVESSWQGSISIDLSSSNREKWICDSGYTGEPDKIVASRQEHPKDFKKFMARVKSRQETFNKRLKVLRVLTSRFHHGMNSDNKWKCIKGV